MDRETKKLYSFNLSIFTIRKIEILADIYNCDKEWVLKCLIDALYKGEKNRQGQGHILENEREYADIIPRKLHTFNLSVFTIIQIKTLAKIYNCSEEKLIECLIDEFYMDEKERQEQGQDLGDER